MNLKKVLSVILGLLMVAAGVYCICTPALTYLILGWVIGVCMVVNAIGSFFTYSERKKFGTADGWTLVGAIISLLLGLTLAANGIMQIMVDLFILYIVAAWLLIMGIIRIMMAIRLYRFRKSLAARVLGRNWGWVLIMGLLLVACGVLSLINPFSLMLAIGLIIGINLIVIGVNLVSLAIIA
ncbi:MAG: DUF308 domain-containing protein [Clostridia bacterium]|nr:DUF308 domain-containing protein [Clostridia bacterium]